MIAASLFMRSPSRFDGVEDRACTGGSAARTHFGDRQQGLLHASQRADLLVDFLDFRLRFGSHIRAASARIESRLEQLPHLGQGEAELLSASDESDALRRLTVILPKSRARS